MSPRTMVFFKKSGQIKTPSPLARGTLPSFAVKNRDVPAIISTHHHPSIPNLWTPKPPISADLLERLQTPFDFRYTNSLMHAPNRHKITEPADSDAWCKAVILQRWYQCVSGPEGCDTKLQIETEEFLDLVDEGGEWLCKRKCVLDNNRPLHHFANLIHAEIHAAMKQEKAQASRGWYADRPSGNFGSSTISPQFIVPENLEFLPLKPDARIKYWERLTVLWDQIAYIYEMVGREDVNLMSDKKRLLRVRMVEGVYRNLECVAREVWDSMMVFVEDHFEEEMEDDDDEREDDDDEREDADDEWERVVGEQETEAGRDAVSALPLLGSGGSFNWADDANEGAENERMERSSGYATGYDIEDCDYDDAIITDYIEPEMEEENPVEVNEPLKGKDDEEERESDSLSGYDYHKKLSNTNTHKDDIADPITCQRALSKFFDEMAKSGETPLREEITESAMITGEGEDDIQNFLPSGDDSEDIECIRNMDRGILGCKECQSFLVDERRKLNILIVSEYRDRSGMFRAAVYLKFGDSLENRQM